jgi:CrcB protein
MVVEREERAPIGSDPASIGSDPAPSDAALDRTAPRGPGPAAAAARRRPPRRYHSRVEADIVGVIALGGMVGASARYGITRLLPASGTQFPWGTFVENMIGSFLLGFLLVLVLERFPPTRYLRPFAATGILGAFTTMSAYTVETALLLKDRYFATGLLYGFGSLAAGLALAYSGIRAGRLTRRRHSEAAP